MGFWGRVTGWQQQKDAHNAVLASHLAGIASPDLKREIAARLILIQQQVRGHRDSEPDAVLAQLSAEPRIVQMNFIALACNSLGIPPALPDLGFETVDNPYRSEDEGSSARIDVAIRDLSRRSGQPLDWPGDRIRIDFSAWYDLRPRPKAGTDGSKTNVDAVTDLVFQQLLVKMIPHATVRLVAVELMAALETDSLHGLALATALFFFEQPEFRGDLQRAQMVARLKAVVWSEDGKIGTGEAQYFSDRLNEIYPI